MRDRLWASRNRTLASIGEATPSMVRSQGVNDSPIVYRVLFCQLCVSQESSLLRTSGVVRIVGTLEPEPIPTEEIAVLQQVSLINPVMEPCDYLADGGMGRIETRSAYGTSRPVCSASGS